MQRHRRTAEGSRRLDELLLEQTMQVERLEQGLGEAREAQGELRTLIDSCWLHLGSRRSSFGWIPTAMGPRALVIHAGTRRLVALSADVDEATLTPGDELYLGKELNVILGKSPDGMPRCGETASFDRRTEDGRLVLRCRDDEEVIVDAAGPLLNNGLQSGDQVRWDRGGWLAFEKLERSKGVTSSWRKPPRSASKTSADSMRRSRRSRTALNYTCCTRRKSSCIRSGEPVGDSARRTAGRRKDHADAGALQLARSDE